MSRDCDSRASGRGGIRGGLHVLKSDGGYVRVAITVDDREEAEAMLDAGERGVMV